MKFKKILTHAGVFHADEVLAIATIKSLFSYEIPIERVNEVSEEDMQDPQVLVLDIGGEYNPELGNFDHHHDRDLSATNVLVLHHFVDSSYREKLRKHLFQYVSDVDTGTIPGGWTEGIPTFNAIIRNLNGVLSFEETVSIAKTILKGYINTTKVAIETENYYFSLERAYEKVVIEEKGTFIPEWKELAKQEGILLMLSPNARGGWQLVSRDSQVLKITKAEGQTFLHASGFMAVYADKETALKHAKKIVSI